MRMLRSTLGRSPSHHWPRAGWHGNQSARFLLSHYVENITMNCIVTCHGGKKSTALRSNCGSDSSTTRYRSAPFHKCGVIGELACGPDATRKCMIMSEQYLQYIRECFMMATADTSGKTKGQLQAFTEATQVCTTRLKRKRRTIVEEDGRRITFIAHLFPVLKPDRVQVRLRLLILPRFQLLLGVGLFTQSRAISAAGFHGATRAIFHSAIRKR